MMLEKAEQELANWRGIEGIAAIALPRFPGYPARDAGESDETYGARCYGLLCVWRLHVLDGLESAT